MQEIRRVRGEEAISPVRTHTQAAPDAQMPDGYSVHTGHIDWVDLQKLDDDRFSFTVLRNPRERLASFYFFLRREGESLTPEALQLKENTGKRHLLEQSIDDYFFAGPPAWRTFIDDHYNNFYVSYLTSRRFRGSRLIEKLTQEERIDRALDGSRLISAIYGLSELDRLEIDLGAALGQKINLQRTRINAGPASSSGNRWDDLMALFERGESRTKIESFVQLDEILMQRCGLEADL